jgi:hypothetical protein
MIDIVAIDTPTLGDRSYLVTDGERAFVVDPQRDIDRVLDLAGEPCRAGAGMGWSAGDPGSGRTVEPVTDSWPIMTSFFRLWHFPLHFT